MSEDVDTKEDSNDTERGDIEDDSSKEAEKDEDGGGTRVTPIKEGMETFKLGSKVTKNGLNSASKTTKVIISNFDDFMRFGGGDRIKFFIKLFRRGCVGKREINIHVRRVSWAKSVLPSSNQEHVEEESGQYEFWIPDKNEVEEMN